MQYRRWCSRFSLASAWHFVCTIIPEPFNRFFPNLHVYTTGTVKRAHFILVWFTLFSRSATVKGVGDIFFFWGDKSSYILLCLCLLKIDYSDMKKLICIISDMTWILWFRCILLIVVIELVSLNFHENRTQILDFYIKSHHWETNPSHPESSFKENE